MKFLQLISICSLVIVFNSCSKITGNGNIIEAQRVVADFNGVDIEIPGSIHVTRGETYSLKLVAESNIEPEVVTQVRDSTLSIKFKNDGSIKSHESISVHITVPTFNHVYIKGSSVVQVDSLSGSRCDISVDGSGEIIANHIQSDHLAYFCNGSGILNILSGELIFKELDINGSGHVKTENVVTTNNSIEINGSGDVYTNTTDSMYIRISGSGNVYYKGSPKINISAIGSGTAKPL